MNIYDITLTISKNLMVYPGNPRPRIKPYASIKKNKINESVISLGSHSGTHVDEFKMSPNYSSSYPVVIKEENNQLSVLLSTNEINRSQSLDELIDKARQIIGT